MGAGKKKLERALSAFSNSKISKPNLVPGALGGYIDGYQQIQVAYRPDFVYVRLRTTDSETIQAFNDKVGIHWDLPILVYRDPESPGVWRVYGRDIRAYDDWEGVAYSNPHAESHSFAGASKTGADVVWTFKRQYMPLLMHPNPTGTMGVYIEPDFYVYQGQVRWWPGSGSTSLAGLKPTGSFTGRFVTVYLNSAGNPDFLGGDEFSALDVPSDPSTYIEIPSTTQGVPLGAVLLLSGTEYIGWGEIYDLRLPNQAVFPMSDVSGSLMFYDEATLQGSAPSLNVTGERLTVRVSGSYATIHASPDPVEQIGVFNVIDPPGSALGTGTVIEWGDNITATISGSTVHIDATAGGGVAHVFPGGALVIPDRYPTMFTFTGSANDAHTNNAEWEDILNLSGQFVLDNVSDVFFEMMVVISNTDNNWNHHYLRVVLDASPLDPAVYIQESAGRNALEHNMTYHALEKNVASGAHTIEGQWYTNSNVNVNIQNRRLTGIAATGGLAYNSGTAAIGVLDEGIYLGAGNIFNFRGQNVEVTISGSAVDVFVTGSSGGGGHETGTLVVYDENVFLGVFEEMRFLGAGVDAYNSGSYVAVSIPGGGGVTVNSDGIMGWDEGIPVGTGSVLNVTGDGASLSISGTVLELNVPGPFLQDDGAPLGYLSAIDFVGAGVTATLLGSQATITIPGGGGAGGGVDQIGIYGLDEGVPLGTGTWVNFRGPNVEASISGTMIDVYISGSSGGGGHETGTLVVYNEDTFLGVFEEMRFIGAGVDAYNSGSYAAVSIPGGGSSFAGVDQIGIYALDEGVPLGTGTWVNFRGPNVEASISGTVIDVYISGSSGGGGGHSTGTMVIYDDGTFLGVFEEMRFIGGGVNAYNSGSYAAISIPSQSVTLAGSYQIEELLYEVVLTSATGSIIVPGIQQTHDHLRWEMQARGDYGAGTDTDIAIRLNNDNTAANYRRISHVALDGTHNTFSADSNVGITSIPCVGGIANVFGWSQGEIPYYALTGAHHLIQGWSQERRAASSSILLTVQMNWEQLAAVNEVRFVPVSGSFATGTRFRLYGQKNSPLPTVGAGLSIGTGTASLRVPDLLNSSKLVASTPDDDFDGVALDGKWTVVQGNPGTVGLIGASGGIYQVGARSGWLSMQVGTAATGTNVQIRQDYTLPSGSSIVIPVSLAMDIGATPTNNEIWLGVGVNQTDTGIMSGTTNSTIMALMDANADGVRAIAYNAAAVLGWDSPGTPHIPDVMFFRIDRAGLVYHAFYSTDGFAWTWIGSNTLASEATNIWIYALCRATSANRMVVGVPWIREGAALANDPWTLNSPETFASIAATDDGAYLGTATVLEGRKSLDFSISGTVLAMDVRLLPQDVYQGSGTFKFPSAIITGTGGDSALAVYGGIEFYGGGTVPAYFGQGAGNNLQMASNVSPLGNLIGDTTKSQWKLVLGAALDQFSVRRSPAGVSYAEATLLSLGGSGNFHVRNGMYLSDVPGAYMGSGTINAREYYKDGVPLTAGPTLSENGVLLGTPANIDLGLGLNATFSGTNVQLDGGRYWMDRIFSSSGSPFDYDFDKPISTAPGWMITGGSAPPAEYDINDSWPSWLHVTFSGSQTLVAVCDVGGQFAPASGSFSVTAHCVWSCDAVANKNINLEIDNTKLGAAYNRMAVFCIRGDPPVVRLDKTVAGSNTFNLGNRNYYDSGGDVYIHIERVGTGSWGAALSSNGMGWHPITALQSQYFGDLNRIKINLSNTSGGIYGWSPWGIDWVKVNHLFLFTRP